MKKKLIITLIILICSFYCLDVIKNIILLNRYRASYHIYTPVYQEKKGSLLGSIWQKVSVSYGYNNGFRHSKDVRFIHFKTDSTCEVISLSPNKVFGIKADAFSFSALLPYDMTKLNPAIFSCKYDSTHFIDDKSFAYYEISNDSLFTEFHFIGQKERDYKIRLNQVLKYYPELWEMFIPFRSKY